MVLEDSRTKELAVEYKIRCLLSLSDDGLGTGPSHYSDQRVRVHLHLRQRLPPGSEHHHWNADRRRGKRPGNSARKPKLNSHAAFAVCQRRAVGWPYPRRIPTPERLCEWGIQRDCRRLSREAVGCSGL